MTTVVITGSNGQLGQFFVKELVGCGFKVIGIDKNPNNFKGSANFHFECLDITKQDQVNDFFIKQKKIDILINNAGIGVFTKFEDRTAEEFTEVMNVNLLGTFLMMRGAVQIMKKNGGGKIINIASIYGSRSSDFRIYGKSGRNNSEVYSATKAGVISLTKYAAAHFAEFNIQVNSISPGGIFNNQATEFVKNYEMKTPVGRMGKVDDLRSTLFYLIDHQNTYVNGQDIAVDGGFLAW